MSHEHVFVRYVCRCYSPTAVWGVVSKQPILSFRYEAVLERINAVCTNPDEQTGERETFSCNPALH